ncbi:MAG TPA: PspC domain-containing protein, partial [Polyangiaceae bacterium]|nr:PspC domain-containing protein [Polyangiaceae bacterium]
MSETDSTSAEARLLPPPAPPAPPVPHRLYRDPKGPIGGVASGFAMYFDLDPVIVRLLWIVSLFTGLGGPGYLVCWVVVPKAKTWPPPGHQSGSLPGARSGTATLTSGLVIVGLAALIGNGLDGAGDLLLPAALVGFGVYLLSQRAAAREGAAPPLPAASPGDTGSVAEGGFAAGGVAAAPASPRGLVTPTVLSLLALG